MQEVPIENDKIETETVTSIQELDMSLTKYGSISQKETEDQYRAYTGNTDLISLRTLSNANYVQNAVGGKQADIWISQQSKEAAHQRSSRASAVESSQHINSSIDYDVIPSLPKPITPTQVSRPLTTIGVVAESSDMLMDFEK